MSFSLGELSEWLKEHAWKACVRRTLYREFESLTLRQKLRRIALPCDALIYSLFFPRSDRSVRVPRNGASRTPSGPEGSSGKRIVSCAAGAPGGCGPTLKRNNQRRQYAILFRVPPLLLLAGRKNAMAQKKSLRGKKRTFDGTVRLLGRMQGAD